MPALARSSSIPKQHWSASTRCRLNSSRRRLAALVWPAVRSYPPPNSDYLWHSGRKGPAQELKPARPSRVRRPAFSRWTLLNRSRRTHGAPGLEFNDASMYRPPPLAGNRNYLSCLSGFVIELERRIDLNQPRASEFGQWSAVRARGAPCLARFGDVGLSLWQIISAVYLAGPFGCSAGAGGLANFASSTGTFCFISLT